MKATLYDRTKELEEMERMYALRQDKIRTRLSDFASVPASEYFYELMYCLLTPQSSAKHAEQVVLELRAAGFPNREVNPEPFLRKKECYIRFHKTKSNYLLRVKDQYAAIAGKLTEPVSAGDLRDWLVQNVLGLGYKEATHFMRNIGKNEGLAILDRHILRNLKRLGLIRSIPPSLSRTQYLNIEKRFSEFATHIGIPLDELDMVFWSMETGEILK
jgi:N-glycosylase/DNA lyase